MHFIIIQSCLLHPRMPHQDASPSQITEVIGQMTLHQPWKQRMIHQIQVQMMMQTDFDVNNWGLSFNPLEFSNISNFHFQKEPRTYSNIERLNNTLFIGITKMERSLTGVVIQVKTDGKCFTVFLWRLLFKINKSFCES